MKSLKLLLSVMLASAIITSCNDNNQPNDPTDQDIDYSLIRGGSSWARELQNDESDGTVTGKVTWTFRTAEEGYEFIEKTERSNYPDFKRSGEWDLNTDKNILSLYFFNEQGTDTGTEHYRVSKLTAKEMVVMLITDSSLGEPMTFTSIETPQLPTDDEPDESDDNRPMGIDISEPIVTDITMSSAVVKGTILGDNVTFKERGVCYSTSQNPTVNDSKVKMSADFVNIHLENLFEGTVYYIRLYAIIGDMVYYGKEVTFETEGKRTYKIELKYDRLADQSLRLQAKLPNEVGKYGLCYGISPHPKVTDDYLPEQNRAISWTIKNIKPNTKYYIRAYHKEGTKITYFDDSEIDVMTLGPDGTDIKLDYTYENEDRNGYYFNVTYTITYSNLPKGMNEVVLYLRHYFDGVSDKITKYIENSSGTLTITPTVLKYLSPYRTTELIVCIKNYETGIWYFKCWQYRASDNPRFSEIDDDYQYFDYKWFD